MGWVKDALKVLKEEGICQIRPHGGSMRGRIESGQLVTIIQARGEEVVIDDVVFIQWKNNYILHLVLDIQEEIQIGNNLGKVNGWIPKSAVIGKVIKVED